jgi:hypothetical protein
MGGGGVGCVCPGFKKVTVCGKFFGCHVHCMLSPISKAPLILAKDRNAVMHFSRSRNGVRGDRANGDGHTNHSSSENSDSCTWISTESAFMFAHTRSFRMRRQESLRCQHRPHLRLPPLRIPRHGAGQERWRELVGL